MGLFKPGHIIALSVLLCLVVAGCSDDSSLFQASDQTTNDSAQSDGPVLIATLDTGNVGVRDNHIPGEKPNKPLAVVNKKTGEPEATNYNDNDFVYVNGAYTPDGANTSSTGIVTIQAVVPLCSSSTVNYSRSVRSGSHPSENLEVWGRVASGCYILTGIGGRIENSGGDANWTTLHIEQRKLNQDGTLGPRQRNTFGSAPNYTVEAWADVPYGYAVTKIEVTGGYDVTMIRMTYQAIQRNANGSFSLTGPSYTAYGGLNPYSAATVIGQAQLTDEMFLGAGFRAWNPLFDDPETSTMESIFGILN